MDGYVITYDCIIIETYIGVNQAIVTYFDIISNKTIGLNNRIFPIIAELDTDELAFSKGRKYSVNMLKSRKDHLK